MAPNSTDPRAIKPLGVMECAREESNLHAHNRASGPQPDASTNSATCALLGMEGLMD